MRSLPVVFAFLLAACSSTGSVAPSNDVDASTSSDTGAIVDSATTALDAPSLDASAEVATNDATSSDASKSAGCATTFGTSLPSGYLRLDGTVVAVIAPNDQTCAMPNSTHLILELSIAGAVYRVVVNVQSDNATDPDVFFEMIAAPLPAPAFSEGWHEGLAFDYVTTLGVHSTDAGWAHVAIDEATKRVTDALDVGAHVSVYASGTGGTSVHLVHRNATNQDGAIVIDPEGAPKLLLFHFDEQTF